MADPSTKFTLQFMGANMRIALGFTMLAIAFTLGGCFDGPKGDKGDKGDPGAVGPQGAKGDKGDPGTPANFRLVKSAIAPNGSPAPAMCDVDEIIITAACIGAGTIPENSLPTIIGDSSTTYGASCPLNPAGGTIPTTLILCAKR